MLAHLLGKLPERGISGTAGIQTETGIQIALRFAPQLLMHAKFAQGQQQSGIVSVFLQPAFGLLDLRDVVVVVAFAVECDQFAIPLRVETVGQQ